MNSPHPRLSLVLTRWHFLAALGLLIVNDHLLKGSGLLPGWLTGKLSDFAGLYLAPPLLARLMRVRTRQGLWACALAIASVFSLLQLSLPFVRVWETASELVGFPWHVTMDATDLVALPMVVLSVLVWSGRARGAECRERALLAVALLACAGSSPPDDGRLGAFESDSPVLVNGDPERSFLVRVQALRADVAIDCAAVAAGPGERLPRTAFAPTLVYQLQPGDGLALDTFWWGLETPGCAAVLLAVDDAAPRVVFWLDGAFQSRSVPSRFDREALASAQEDPRFLILRSAGEGVRFPDTDANVLFAFEPRHDVPEDCRVQSEPVESWTDFPLYDSPLRLVSKHYGRDGCFALELEAAPTVSDDVAHDPGDAGVGVGSDSPSPWADGVPELDAGFGPEQDSGAGGSSFADADAGPFDAGSGPEQDSGAGGAGGSSFDADADAGPFGAVVLRQGLGPRGTVWLCVPEEAFPFEPGELLTARLGTNSLSVVAARTSLSVFRESAGQVSATAEFSPSQEGSCPHQVFEQPTLSARRIPTLVSTPWGAVTLEPGEQHTFRTDTHVALVGLLAARSAIVGGTGAVMSGFSMVSTNESEER